HQRSRGGRYGIRYPGRLRRADRGQHRTSHRTRRHQGRQQGRRAGQVRDRDGRPAQTVGVLMAHTAATGSSGFSTVARSKARRLAMQAVYQWQMTAHDAADILAQSLADEENRGIDAGYFEALVRGVVQGHAVLDALLEPT